MNSMPQTSMNAAILDRSANMSYDLNDAACALEM